MASVSVRGRAAGDDYMRRLVLCGALLSVGVACSERDEDGVQSLSQRLGAADAAVVISQVYGGGGNALAPFKNDFVELFNRSRTAVELDGWSVQYASASGTGTFASNAVTPVSGTLAPGQYFLVQMAAGSGSAPVLPVPDAIGTVNMSASGGKVALVSSTAGLACNGPLGTPCTPTQEAQIIDLVGYGGANYYEGTAAPPGTNTSGLLRAAGGCTDSNDNAADLALAAPLPRNSASPAAACTGNTAPSVISTSPANGAQGVSALTPIVVTFSEPVTTAADWYSISCSASGSVAATTTGGTTSFTLTPSVDLQTAETCAVTLKSAAISDADGTRMFADFVFGFTIALPLTSIHDIQGAQHVSPRVGTAVRTSGVVTAVRSNGFYLQEPDADADPRTSEGILVFTNSRPSVLVGDSVEVSGRVTEFRPGCSGSCAPSSSGYANLSVTEITAPSVSVVSSGNALPPPLPIGAAGRIPPNQIIEDDTDGNLETDDTSFDPAQDGADFYESVEGMRVSYADALVVGPTKTFGATSKEIYIVGDGGTLTSSPSARGGVVITAQDKNPERIVLATGILSTLPDADVGDSFVGSTIGVVDYDFGNYRLVASEPLPLLVRRNLARERVGFTLTSASDLNIAAFNVENIDPGDPDSKFAELASIVVQNLGSPDIVSLEEIQDNSGPSDDGVVDASQTVAKLVSAIRAAGGPSYEFRGIDPENDSDGGEPGGNIRVGFLFRSDRGLAFVDRPGADAHTPNRVQSSASGPRLEFSPGRIDPLNAAFASSRKPLAAEFVFGGERLFVIANHFNSKGGDQPLFGRFQPPTLSSEAQRIEQARVVASFVSQLLQADPEANVAVLGDLNDFEFSAPVGILKDAGLTPLIETLPPEERYTYVFEGNSQALDHVLVSPHALGRTAGFDVVHVNAEFAAQSSDHDPGVARLRLNAVAPVLLSPGDLNAEATGPGGSAVQYSVVANDDVDGDVPVACAPSSGSTFALGSTRVDCSAIDAQGNVGRTSFFVTVKDSLAPLFGALPAEVSAFATSRAGARVDYATPLANDVVSGAVPVACSPASGTVFPLGSSQVTCRAADAAGNAATVQFGVNVTVAAAPGPQLFMQPINSDGSSIFRLGRTVPVKFALSGASAGIRDLDARLYVAKVSNGVEGEFVEADSTCTADSGNAFRYDRVSRLYEFNLALRGPLFSRGTFALRADLGDGVDHVVHVSVRN